MASQYDPQAEQLGQAGASRNPYLAAASVGTDATSKVAQGYMMWKEAQAQKARQKMLDRQALIDNNRNLAEYEAGDPVGTAERAAMRDRISYLQYLASLKV